MWPGDWLKRLRGRRVRTPTCLQMEAVECGAAALSIILGHFGRFVSLEELRHHCGVSRDGTKASNIVLAARHYGLEAKGLSVDINALDRLSMPIIIFWNFNHFLVVEEFSKKVAYLNDPATGPRRISRAEFAEAFTGVVLTFQPGPDFRTGGKRPDVVRSLRGRLGGAHAGLTLVVMANLVLVVPMLCVAAFNRVFTDYFIIERNEDWLVPLLAAMVAVAVVRMSLHWLQQSYLLRLQTSLAVTSSSKFLHHVLRLPLGFFAQRYAGEVASRVDLNDRVARLVSSDLAATVLSAITLVLYAAVMAQYSRLLTAIAIILAALNVGLLASIVRDLKDASQRSLLDRGRMVATGLQGLQMIEDLRLRGTDSVFFERLTGCQARAINADQDLSRHRLLLNALPVFIGSSGLALIMMVGGYEVMSGGMTIGMLVAYQSLMGFFFSPVNNLVRSSGQIQDIEGYVSRLDDILAQPLAHLAAPACEAAPSPALPLRGAIEFRGVTFGYAPLAPPLLDGFSLTVRPGERVAVVGVSGSGKSTIGRLLAGHHMPWKGEILVDGRPLMEIPSADLRRGMAVVDQDICVFTGSVRDNLTLWDGSIGDDELVRAAKDAAIHDEIISRLAGYDTPVLSGGRNFSGGELQRLEIARALVGRPAILVLDEATSALDAAVEEEIMQGLRRRGCTLFVIAHRLKALRCCDRIVVLDRGRVVEQGGYGDLATRHGPFRTLLEA